MAQYPGLVPGRVTAGSPSFRPATAPTCSKNGAWRSPSLRRTPKCRFRRGVKYLAVFDPAAEELTAAELLWLAAANTDPRRDVRTEGAALVIDARSKRPGAGENPGRFPNVVTASEATVALVDRRWPEYGLGAFVGSPSRRYRRLLLSDGAQWR